MSTPSPRPQTPQALRRSLDAKLRAEARAQGANITHVRKQYVFTLPFKRLFHDADGSWALVGGNALLLRTGGGRFTDDVDLTYTQTWEDSEQLRTELTRLASHDLGDGFTFRFTRADNRRQPDDFGYGTTSAKVAADALLAGKVFETFTLDIALKRHVQDPVDYVPARPVIEHPTLDDLPRVPVVHIESHLADKICAMYETHHGGKPSTRYRDLADIVRIVTNLPIDAARLTQTLEHEAGRRHLELPSQLISPHEQWQRAYPDAAKKFSEFPAEYQSLEASLARAARCLAPVLSREVLAGTWDPHARIWTDA